MEIKKVRLERPDMFNVISYGEEGVYIVEVEGEASTEIVVVNNDLAWACGTVSAHFINEYNNQGEIEEAEAEDVKEEAKQPTIENKERMVSEDFTLKMLSIAMGNDKYQDLK